MKTRKVLFGALLASAFVLAACSQPTPEAEVVSEDAVEVESSEEMMEDDEMVDEDADEMMDDEMMEDDMMDQQTTFVIRI